MSPRPKPSEPLIYVGVKFPESLVRAVDRVAEQQEVTRSDVVRAAVEKLVERGAK